MVECRAKYVLMFLEEPFRVRHAEVSLPSVPVKVRCHERSGGQTSVAIERDSLSQDSRIRKGAWQAIGSDISLRHRERYAMQTQ